MPRHGISLPHTRNKHGVHMRTKLRKEKPLERCMIITPGIKGETTKVADAPKPFCP